MAALLLMMASFLGGCVANAPFRTVAGECLNPCSTGSVEHHMADAQKGVDYLLGVVEFDDQGAKLKPEQMERLFERLQRESEDRDLSIVVFVHGWQHNGAYDDSHLEQFRVLLNNLAITEQTHAPSAYRGLPRKVVGIYASWRGKSLDAGVLSDLTFWSRKAAASRVAEGSIRELLARARALRDTIDRTTWGGRRVRANEVPPPGERLRSTRLLTIGHSFGGLIVYTALAQYMTDRAAASMMADQLGQATEEDRVVAPYGDLVVIVNPAVEAISWEPVHQLMVKRPVRSYAQRQNPVFIEVTSTADSATGKAFPVGRWINTILEGFTSAGQRDEAQTAVGHYEPFVTHELYLPPSSQRRSAAEATAALKQQVDEGEFVRARCADRWTFERTYMRNGHLTPGWTRQFNEGAVVRHLADRPYDPDNPFWVVRTDKTLIPSHSEIMAPAFVDFVRQVYDDMLLDEPTCAGLLAGRPGLAEPYVRRAVNQKE